MLAPSGLEQSTREPWTHPDLWSERIQICSGSFQAPLVKRLGRPGVPPPKLVPFAA